MKTYNSTGNLRIIDEFDEMYQEILNTGGFVSKMNRALYLTISFLFLLLVLYLCFWRIFLSQTEYIQCFLLCCAITSIFFLVYIQKVRNKMYQFYGIELESRFWFNFQTKAQISYNQIIGNLFEDKMIKEGNLFNSENDIELLNIYIKLIDEEIKTKRKQSLFESQKVAIVISLLTLGSWFISLICSHYDLNIFSFGFLLAIILTSIVLWLILYVLTQVSKIYIDIQNKKVYRLERVSKFLKSILIKREIEKSRQVDEYKSLNFFQKLKKKITKANLF